MKNTVKKIPFYQAENILNSEFPMFDRKTNKMFGTVATYLVIKNGKPTSIRVKNNRFDTISFYDYPINEPKNALSYI